MKNYIYKWYSDDSYVGVLDNVISEFNLREEINSAGSQLQIKLGKSLDASNVSLLTDLVVDENDNNIVTDNLESIITSLQINIDNLPELNDKIEVWEFTDSLIETSQQSELLGVSDTFTGDEINQLLWETYGDVQAIDTLVINLDGTTPSYNGVYSKVQHNLENKYIVVEAVDTVTDWTSMEMSMQILQGNDPNNKIFMLYNNNTLSACKTIGGVLTVLASTAFNASTMSWWKIANYNGVSYFQYSSNGIVWVTLYSMENVINFSSNEIHLEAGNYNVESGTSILVFDNFNVLPENSNRITESGGTLVFNGLVSSWETDYSEENITINLLSYGVELSNHLVQEAVGDTVVINASNWDDRLTIYPASKSGNNIWLASQTITFDSDTTVKSIVIGMYNNFEVAKPYKLTVIFAEGEPADWSAPLGKVTLTMLITPGEEFVYFTFPNNISVSASKDYYFYIANYTSADTFEIDLLTDTSAEYVNGEAYTHNKVDFTLQSYDLVFWIESGATALGKQYNSTDPSRIVADLLDNYNSLGGTIKLSDEVSTNTVVSYTFKYNTYLEAINKCLELAPANWWWRVDVATNLLYFKPKSGTASHTFVKGKHIQNLQIKYSLEQMKNAGYFVGGEIAGENLVTSHRSQSSINQYGHWLETITDNRVTLQDTADILLESAIGQSKNPTFSASLLINSGLYDTNSVQVGQVINLRNYNEIIDSLLFQIMAKVTTSNHIELTLGLLPPTVSKRVEDIKRNLLMKETENTPE